MEEKKELKLKKNISKEAIIGGGIVLAAVIFGYNTGCKVEAARIGWGLEQCFKTDPSLESHIWEAIGKRKAMARH